MAIKSFAIACQSKGFVAAEAVLGIGAIAVILYPQGNNYIDFIAIVV
jgi:hypothetical protein